MKNDATILLPIFVFMTLSGCATQQLHYQGSTVEVVQELNRNDCENLGPVYGKGGGAFGGALLSDEALMEYSTNALRNNAGQRGATHVTYTSHQMGAAAGGPTTATATISGVAWKCPPRATLTVQTPTTPTAKPQTPASTDSPVDPETPPQ